MVPVFPLGCMLAGPYYSLKKGPTKQAKAGHDESMLSTTSLN